MVNEIGAQSGKRAITLYETTDTGLMRCAGGCSTSPARTRSSSSTPSSSRPGWPAARTRSTSSTRWIGISRRPGPGWTRRCGRGSVPANSASSTTRSSVISFAVLDYAIRGLYAEISNITQLRDEIASGTTRDPVRAGAPVEGADPPSSAHGLSRLSSLRLSRPPSSARRPPPAAAR